MIRRRIPSKDDKTILRLIRQLLIPYAQQTNPDTGITLKELQKRLQPMHTWVAEEAGRKTVGFISLRKERDVLYVDMLAVDRTCQKRGFGSQFMEKVERMARQERCSEIRLWVDEQNGGAQQFYSKKGFEPVQYNVQIRCYLLSKTV